MGGGQNQLRDTNADEEEEVTESDVMLNDSASKNNAASVVLEQFGFTRQPESPSTTLCKKNEMSVR